MKRRSLLGRMAAAGLGAWAPAHAVGYDVRPWPATQSVPVQDWVDLQGQRWSPPALRGRAVLINFWATWCEPCKEEMPSLQVLAKREASRLAVITINLKESPETIGRFVQSTGLQLPVVRDADGSLARAWGVRIYPSTVLVDAKGRVRSVVRGGLDWAGSEGAALIAPLVGDMATR